jgi:hypothetical protein
MAERTLEKLNVGELVKWYESYAEGFMTKDAGYGIVVNVVSYELGYGNGPYTSYTVYRNKHSDTMKFTREELELLDEQ